ncbi:MAG: proline--tRNA ligase [Candidatus Omnitrophota bacterium]|nr:proline--tRNA ligase [Candidatus Omnitrophota bacterium]
MRMTKAFIPTLKEIPQGAEIVSHVLMIRAGLIRKLASGAYTYLPLGLKVLKKVEGIIREEMNKAGAQELLLPAIQPVELWKKSGRLEALGEDMVRFTDRHGKETVLGPTHEEAITQLVANEIKSYRQLPLTLYQIQVKFRDEIRPRFGVIRSREFIMKDAYSFDRDTKGLEESYKKMFGAYCRIFDRCGLSYEAVEADPGVMGGGVSHEFMAHSPGGEPSRNIEIGHTFKLGTKYSELLGAKFSDENGKEKVSVMGCYGIGVNRIIAACIEASHDKNGIIWPFSIAPYQVVILPLNMAHRESRDTAEGLYEELLGMGIEVMLDDRAESAGVKFKDADLTGIPIAVIIGERALAGKKLEFKSRKDKKSELLSGKEVVEKIKALLKA